MPTFFFNTNDDVGLWDEEGTELPDLEAARRVAIRYAGELLREGPSLAFGETWQLRASDASNAILFTIDVRITPNPATLSVPRPKVAHRPQQTTTQQHEDVAHSN